ncbi:MAG: chromophore lyase CpcT/CpeT [Bacteroidota bacterium]
MKKYILILAALAIFGCKNNRENPTEIAKEDVQLKVLFDLMQGSFNSQKQAAVDSSYYDISLHMYPIWEGEGNYLYVEQALSSVQDKPYRQRVYKVTRLNDSTISSAVYTLPNDSIWVGKWKTPEAFNAISPSDLSLREGCAVLLEWVGDKHYKGATSKDGCKSSLRGASYATSIVEITASTIASWDQGFDSNGDQVWGAEKGGYIFDRIE